MTDSEMQMLHAMRANATAKSSTKLKFGIAGKDHESALVKFETALKRGPNTGIYVVHFDAPECCDVTGAESIYVAVTGNGPQSEANARFIVCAFNNWDLLLDEHEFLRAEVRRLQGDLAEANRMLGEQSESEQP